MSKFRFRHPFVALLLLVSMLCQGTWALAGTTGGLNGVVTDNNGAPLANAKVSVVSPSQSDSTTTDAGGHFVFLSLAPDSYTVAVEKQGYEPVSVAGINVFADQTQTLTLHSQRTIKEIGRVTSRATSDIVRPGTTADVYSVNAARQETVQSLGGGGNLDNTFSAVASVPGTYVPANSSGWGTTIYIRGSSYSQIGYEFDGIPVNRAFDNYQATTNSNLGQQELQVYTGGSPAGSSSQTLTGFINQVIKTGTYPGFANIDLGVGAPTFYHKAAIEIGGATPNRNFSYFLAASGANQSQRYNTQFNGSPLDSLSQGIENGFGLTTNTFYGGAFTFCTPGSAAKWTGVNGYNSANPPPGGDPGCMGAAPTIIGLHSDLQDRENIVNLHFGIPHKKDGGKDDIQLLYAASSLHTLFYGSVNDIGGSPAGTGNLLFGNPNLVYHYQDGYRMPIGTQFGQSAVGISAIPYLFPNTGTQRPFNAAIDPNARDGQYNDSGTLKLQYQHNIGSSAYLRGYGYIFYSDWLLGGATSSAFYACCYGVGASNTRDYELTTHTRGAELQYANQINSKNLLTLTGNYVTASVGRFNNGTFKLGLKSAATNYADKQGNCYNYTTGALDNCYNATTAGTFGDPTRNNTKGNPTPGAPWTAPAGSAAALAGASWIVTVPGEQGTWNTVQPQFTSASLTDQWKPTDKLLVNAGLRYEDFLYKRPTQTTPEDQFWFNAGANAFCYDPATKTIVTPPTTNGAPPNFSALVATTCPNSPVSGLPTIHPNGQNGAPLFGVGTDSNLDARFISPRLGLTYTVNPDTVVRISAGQQVEPANTAGTQYLDKSARNAALFNAASFVNYGYFTPTHNQQMQVGKSVDISLEKHVKGTDISWKLTPFYRWSAHQLTNQIIGPGFVTSFNDSNQRTWGFELSLQKGDTSRDGLSYGLSYSYTFAQQYWLDASNGQNRIDIINGFIDGYNALTSGGNRQGVKGAPCYATDGAGNALGTPDPTCASTSIRNPYFNKPAQPILNRTQGTQIYPNWLPFQPLYDGVVTGFGNGESAFPPHVFTGFLNYKRDKWTFTPNFQFTAGQRYGDPLASSGLDPRVCGTNSAAAGITAVSPATDPLQANYLTCGASSTPGGLLAIPNPYTGSFDGLAAYREPSQLNVGMQIMYDITPKAKATLILSNLINRCFGGTATPWTSAFPANGVTCAYDAAGGSGLYAGNFVQGTGYNDTAANGLLTPQNFRYPYVAGAGNYPFNAFFKLDFKI